MSILANSPSPAPGMSDGRISTISGCGPRCGLVARSFRSGGFAATAAAPASPRSIPIAGAGAAVVARGVQPIAAQTSPMRHERTGRG
jgi:hypothetical protein